MPPRVERNGLQIAEVLVTLVEHEILPGTGVDPDQFWVGFASVVADFAPRNKQLLQKRDSIQSNIDEWHRQNKLSFDSADYKKFLQGIDYLVPEGPDFSISTTNVDPEF